MLAMSPMLLISRWSRSDWVNAWMLIGTRSMFSSRRCAVTTTSSSAEFPADADESASAAAALAVPRAPPRDRSIKLGTRRPLLTIVSPQFVLVSSPLFHLLERALHSILLQ